MVETASVQAARMRLDDVPYVPGRILIDGDPDDTSIMVRFLGEDMEKGPWCTYIKFGPNVEEASHSHGHDTIYLFMAGSMTIGEEGTFRAGDVRWVRGGHFYGPEAAGPEGVEFFLISLGPEMAPNYTPPEER